MLASVFYSACPESPWQVITIDREYILR